MWRWQERRGNQPKRRKRRERGSPVGRDRAVNAGACCGNKMGSADYAAAWVDRVEISGGGDIT